MDGNGWDDEGEPDEEPTIPCPHCRRQIHEESQRCPYCENYISEEDTVQWFVLDVHKSWTVLIPARTWWIIIGALLVFYLIYRWIAG